MTVEWTIGHYTMRCEQRKHLSFDEHEHLRSERTLEKTVLVQRYGQPSLVQVFLLPEDELEIWVYDAGPQNRHHPSKRSYPSDPRLVSACESIP